MKFDEVIRHLAGKRRYVYTNTALSKRGGLPVVDEFARHFVMLAHEFGCVKAGGARCCMIAEQHMAL